MNFTDILSEYRVSYREAGSHHHATHGWVQTDCPRCSPNSGRFRLGYNIAGGFTSCWICGSTPLIQTLADLIQQPYSKAAELLHGIDRPLSNTHAKVKGTLKLPKGLGPLQEPHRKYLESRGFDPEHLEAFWGIKGIGLAYRLSWRIWLPIHYQGQIVSWTTRSISNNSPMRYINALPSEESLSAKSILSGLDHIRHSAIVVEGPFDMLAIGPGAVCTFGIVYSRSQVLALSKIPLRVICFDREPDAQRRARKLCHELSSFPGETVCVELRAKDPAVASKNEIRELRKRFLE